MGEILVAEISYETGLGQDLGQWIAENYHPDWPGRSLHRAKCRMVVSDLGCRAL